jgi:hypothetical protein
MYLRFQLFYRFCLLVALAILSKLRMHIFSLFKNTYSVTKLCFDVNYSDYWNAVSVKLDLIPNRLPVAMES